MAEAHYNASDQVVSMWGLLCWHNIRQWHGGQERERWLHAARTGEPPSPNPARFAMPVRQYR